jgi:hypothetical protein
LGRRWNQLATVAWGIQLEDATTVILEGALMIKTGKMGS